MKAPDGEHVGTVGVSVAFLHFNFAALKEVVHVALHAFLSAFARGLHATLQLCFTEAMLLVQALLHFACTVDADITPASMNAAATANIFRPITGNPPLRGTKND
jgi:hypothetical protein